MYRDRLYLCERAILSPTKLIVDEINTFILGVVPGEAKEYLSYDTMSTTNNRSHDMDALYPTEFLNSVSVPNFPNAVEESKPKFRTLQRDKVDD